MLGYVKKIKRYRSAMKEFDKGNNNNKGNTEDQEEKTTELSEELDKNLEMLSNILIESSDVVKRRFVIGKKVDAAIVYIDGLIDKAMVTEAILKPLMYFSDIDPLPDVIDINYVKSTLVLTGSIEPVENINKAIDKILSGDTILIIDKSPKILAVSLRGWNMRGIQEPQTESVVRGPREGFTETMRVNTSLLRRKIKNPNLKFETVTIGDRTKTDVCISYISGLAKPELIDEVKKRLSNIKIDGVLESGYIEQYIEDAPYSIFSTVGNSEKPDKVASKLLEGRAAILVDGTPFVLTVPMLFVESFQSSEDYYSRAFFVSFIRILRFIAFFISILAPALYVALSNFHQELIPTPLLLSMAAAHEGVPFPATAEAFIMLIFFEILREAGVRLPRPVGQAVSIVGALVIGEAAVSAGLIGAPLVIVVAVTAVSSFTVPTQTDSGTIMCFALLLLAGFMGGFGISIGLFAIIIHMATIKSFGIPYMMPFMPYDKSGLKDTAIRAPLWTMRKRPKGMSQDDIRQKKMSGPPQQGKNDDSTSEEPT